MVKDFSLEEIQGIITSCGKAGVSVLKYGGLYLRFGTPPNAQPAEPAQVSSDPSAASAAEIAASMEKEGERSLIQSETDLKQDQLAEMLINDPVGAEKLLIDNASEFEDERDDAQSDGS